MSTAHIILGLVILGVIWGGFSLLSWQGRKKTDKQLLQPDEQYIRSTRRHKVVLVGAGLVALVGAVLFAASLAIVVHHPRFSVSTPRYHPIGGPQTNGFHFSISLLWIPATTFVVFAILTLWVWQGWSRYRVVLTTNRIIQWHRPSVILPLLGRKVDPTNFEQITDINDNATGLGGSLDWGTLTVVYNLLSGEKDKNFRLTFIPDSAGFAFDAKVAWSTFKEEQDRKKNENPLRDEYYRLQIERLKRENAQLRDGNPAESRTNE